MKNRSIFITEYDLERLRKLIEDEKRYSKRNLDYLHDTIEWQVPGGLRQLEVKQILYQPEASGDYHL